MKRFLLILALFLIPSGGAFGQCNGVFPANTICGTIAGGIPGQVSTSALTSLPGGSPSQTQYNNAGNFGGYTPGGDCTVVTATGIFTCLKTNGVSFGPFATTASATTATAALNLFSTSLQGLVPSSGGGTANFLRADGTWVAPPIAWTNVRLAKTTNYTAVSADCGSTIALGGTSFYSITITAASGYTATCAFFVLNEDSGRGKALVINGLTTTILYPLQTAIIYNQNNVWQVSKPARWKLTAGPTFFVDVTNGNDTNDCLAAGSGNACLTLQAAWNKIVNDVDMQGFTTTMQLADGTYTTGINSNLGPLGATYLGIIILGNVTTPANVLLSCGASDCFRWFETGTPISVWIKSLKMQSTGGDAIRVLGAGNYVRVTAVNFGGVGTGVHIRAYNFAEVDAFTDSYTISGNASAHFNTNGYGQIGVQNETITITGTPAFSSAFATIQGGNLLVQGDTFSGTATGARFSVNLGGVIDTAGAGATYLPGNAAGTTNCAVTAGAIGTGSIGICGEYN